MAHKSAAFGLKWRSSPTDIRNHYAKRSAQYDKEVSDEIGYVAPRKAAETLATWIKNKDARILDAGAGTGLVGKCLQQLGYNNLDALDICPEMIEIAERKGVYKNMYVDILGGPNPIQLPSNQYDAVVCVGVIEQPGPAALDELIRITKHNGIIVFTWQKIQMKSISNRNCLKEPS
ncbi:uncharacterized protein LOC106164884 [Lingula anatina]|uniref:Uncharacterized protein LOC106164884 n=1 Tax=Lingula anatina TaxID=7574 RepID=A0A1S3IKG5_LINAN|nr:uncharacterized protein LOC106164884 [Lingula anatina]|eukprot:XP_013398381.1 uncharacterized protein LOC106164884 [Lingula anatina]